MSAATGASARSGKAPGKDRAPSPTPTTRRRRAGRFLSCPASACPTTCSSASISRTQRVCSPCDAVPENSAASGVSFSVETNSTDREMIARRADDNPAAVAVLFEHVQERTLRHVCQMIRQEKAEDAHSILLRIEESQFVRNLLLLIVRSQLLHGGFHVLGCVIRNLSAQRSKAG